MLLALKREGGHEPKNVGGLYQLEMAWNQILSWSLQKETNPSETHFQHPPYKAVR